MSTPSTSRWTPVAWARNGQVQLAYDRWQPEAGGEPLLIVSGLGASRRMIPDGLCAELAARGFAVARYDNRDAGESTHLPPTATSNPITSLFRKRGEAYTAEDMADDAISVLDALGWESAHLFGQSLGGAVAQRIALRHPGRVRTLTSMSAIPGDAAGMGTLKYIRTGTLSKFARLKFPDTREGTVEAGVAIQRLLASPNHPFDEAAARETAERVADSGLHDAKAQSRQIGAQWHGPKITEITVPTLVLHGADDPLIKPTGGRRTAARIPGARLRILPGVGHDLPDSAWKDIADAIGELTAGAADGKPGTNAPAA
ncbi:alpha/beta hydrolase [Streptomyces sp. A7024]|uniref:Alpha/beta hydrolase n=1 Tax=Streptomyces coryli TaxID=1128680 RepID=A0A6G4TSU7_9ACTN|nr:alpha/beta hydrolase [Streptomyces coryli]NGN62610.1 alpha/beta hydrolase [Streptomyces coryli]